MKFYNLTRNQNFYVGCCYGRKTMYGLLRVQGWHVGDNRVGSSLQRVSPVHHQCRRAETSRHMNPHSYEANYYGHKVHLDWNKKLLMFGVTHIMAIDRYSGKNCFLSNYATKEK